LVCSGKQGSRVSTSIAFTQFENNTGWTNSLFLHSLNSASSLTEEIDAWAFLLAFTAPMWTLTGYDSAAHIAEEVSGASRAAPLAILLGVGFTSLLGWLLLIAASFASTSVPDLLSSALPLPMGQLFLDTLGKKGMLAIWSFIIVVQVPFLNLSLL
jgi:amino acid transporter